MKLFEFNTTYTAYSTHHPHIFKSLGHVITGTKTNLNINLKRGASSLSHLTSLGYAANPYLFEQLPCALIPKPFSWHHRDG